MNRDKAARVIQDFYKKRTAVATRNDMFRRSPIYNKLNVKDNNDDIAYNNYRLDLLGKFPTPIEMNFLQRFMATKFYAVHATNNENAINSEGGLTLYSHRKLKEKNIPHTLEYGTSSDIARLQNDNYVFFSLEAGLGLQKPSSRFGNIMYRIPLEHRVFFHADILLVDALLTWPYNSFYDFQMSPRISSKRMTGGGADTIFDERRSLKVSALNVASNNIICTLRLLGLSIIKMVQRLHKDDKAAFLTVGSDEDVNNVLNGVFRPEVRVPVIASFKKGEYEKIIR